MQTSGARALREDDQPMTSPTGRFDRAPVEAVPRRPTSRFERSGTAERRTITITGHPDLPPRRRRSPTQQQIAARPDRVALWAFLLGLFLVLVAAATANAAPL
jgi:hypothetical protein